MMPEKKTSLTAAEIGAFRTAYMNDSMSADKRPLNAV